MNPRILQSLNLNLGASLRCPVDFAVQRTSSLIQKVLKADNKDSHGLQRDAALSERVVDAKC